jgi:hypothetical protein
VTNYHKCVLCSLNTLEIGDIYSLVAPLDKSLELSLNSLDPWQSLGNSNGGLKKF